MASLNDRIKRHGRMLGIVDMAMSWGAAGALLGAFFAAVITSNPLVLFTPVVWQLTWALIGFCLFRNDSLFREYLDRRWGQNDEGVIDYFEWVYKKHPVRRFLDE